MIRTDRQDAVVKGVIAALCVSVLVIYWWEWYYEAAVIVTFGILGWLANKKVRTRRKLAVVTVAIVGLALTIGINRLVTHELVVENRTGSVISWVYATWNLPPDSTRFLRSDNVYADKVYTIYFRSLLYDGNLAVWGTLPDGSIFDGRTWDLEEKYRGKNHAIIHEDGEVEILRH